MRFNILNRKENGGVVNHQGAKAFRLTPQFELYAAVAAASLSDNFYEKADARLSRIRELIAQNEPGFVAKLAVYTREQMYLRSVPMVLAVELAKSKASEGIVTKTVSRIVQRADEITELLSYYSMANQRSGTKVLNKLSKQVQKGLAMSFNKFDEYQFAKYNRDGAIKLRDALFIIHPKPKDEAQQLLFNKIAQDTLSVPYTWETELSALGQKKFETTEARKAAFNANWQELIDSGKLGYMATLRNLRNILEAEVSADHIAKICGYLARTKSVENSKQLPIRFLAAWREIAAMKDNFYAARVMAAIEQALVTSVNNVRGFDANTRVVIACDVSGSMQKPISAKSKIMNYDIGLLLGMLLKRKCKSVIAGMFGNTWKVLNLPANNILMNVQEFYRREGEVGNATNGYLVLEDLVQRRVVADRIMMFTDCQMWNSNAANQQSAYGMIEAWKKYKQIAPGAKLYLFDLAGYGKTPLDCLKDDVFLIAGWSDKIFDVLEAIENGGSAIEKINKINLN